MEDKEELRRKALAWRDAVAGCDWKEWSLAIQRKVRDSAWYRDAGVILSYASFRSEAGTDQLNEWILQDGKMLYLPRTDPKRREMAFYRVTDMAALVSGYQGIREPEGGELLVCGSGGDTLMVMPGTAFDARGNRIGYGGGYYDRYLSRYGGGISHTIMLAFMGQRVPGIDVGACDVPPDYIMTEE